MKYPWFHLGGGGAFAPPPLLESRPQPPLCNLFANMHTTITLYVASFRFKFHPPSTNFLNETLVSITYLFITSV